MGYAVGDTVVCPHHGAGVIEARQRREYQGTTLDYFVLRMAHGDLTLMVPEERCDQVGIRPVVSAEEVDRVLSILASLGTPRPTTWSRRFKANYERLRSGDVFQIAEAVRDLAHYDGDGGLSAGERRMLATAKELLYGELCAALGKSAAEVATLVSDLLPTDEA